MTEMISQRPLVKIADVATALAVARTLDGISELMRESVAPLLGADELILDVTSPQLNRPALVRVGVQDEWARRYNDEFHLINPAVAVIERHLADSGTVVRRFADLCEGPVAGTRFFQEYMKPQRHRDSVVAAMSLEASGSLAPVLTILAVRHDDKPDFDGDDVGSLSLLLPATAWGVHRAMRSSESWAKAVIRSAFAMPPKLAEVAYLLSRGMTNGDIAEELNLTIGTVKQYVHQILELTGASSRTDLCRMILG
jgi:hypothetical protein